MFFITKIINLTFILIKTLYVFILVLHTFWGKVSLYSPGYSLINNLSVSTFWVLGLTGLCHHAQSPEFLIMNSNCLRPNHFWKFYPFLTKMKLLLVYIEFQASKGYTVRLCHQEKKKILLYGNQSNYERNSILAGRWKDAFQWLLWRAEWGGFQVTDPRSLSDQLFLLLEKVLALRKILALIKPELSIIIHIELYKVPKL